MAATDSFIISDVSPSTDNDDVDSLPSISSGVLSSEGESDAQKEWEASLDQLQLLLTMVLIPFVGKYFGRKFAYWSESPWLKSSLKSSADHAEQVGRATWSGHTMSRSDGRTRRYSIRLEP